MAATREAMIAKAVSTLNYVEGANNNTTFGKWYGLNFQPWCDMWISWVAHFSGCGEIVGRYASTILHMAYFKSMGRFGTKPERGAIAFMNFGGRPKGVPEHVGLIEAVLSDGRVQTLEGNTSSNDSGSQRNGGMVARRKRSVTNIIGYGYPKYAEGAKYKVTKTHGAHILPTWASPSRTDCKMSEGQTYPWAGGKSGDWVKVWVYTKSRKRVQAWAYTGYLKKL